MNKSQSSLPENISEHLVAFMHGELSGESKEQIETALENSPELKEEFASYQMIADLFTKTIEPAPAAGFLDRMEKRLKREREAGRISQRIVALRDFSQEMSAPERIFAPWVMSLVIHAAAIAIAVTIYLNNTSEPEEAGTMQAGLIPTILENNQKVSISAEELYLLVVDSLGEKPWRGKEKSLFKKRLDAKWRHKAFEVYGMPSLELRLNGLIKEIKAAQNSNGSWGTGKMRAQATCLALLTLTGSGEQSSFELKEGLSYLLGQEGRLALQKEGANALGLALALAVESSALETDKNKFNTLKSFIRDMGSALGHFQKKDAGFSNNPTSKSEVKATLSILYALSLAQAGHYKIRNRSMLLALKYLISQQEKNSLAEAGLLFLMEFQGVNTKEKSIKKLADKVLENSLANRSRVSWQEKYWAGLALYFNSKDAFKKHIQAVSKNLDTDLSLTNKCYQALCFETVYRYPSLRK